MKNRRVVIWTKCSIKISLTSEVNHFVLESFDFVCKVLFYSSINSSDKNVGRALCAYRWASAISWHTRSSPWLSHLAACNQWARRRWHPPYQDSWPPPLPPLGRRSAQTDGCLGPGSAQGRDNICFMTMNNTLFNHFHLSTGPWHTHIRWMCRRH